MSRETVRAQAPRPTRARDGDGGSRSNAESVIDNGTYLFLKCGVYELLIPYPNPTACRSRPGSSQGASSLGVRRHGVRGSVYRLYALELTIYRRLNVPPLFIVPPPREREHEPRGPVPPSRRPARGHARGGAGDHTPHARVELAGRPLLRCSMIVRCRYIQYMPRSGRYQFLSLPHLRGHRTRAPG